jgi:alpha-N-arabinofuranosidase
VSGNSPPPKPTDPPGGEQPGVNAGSATFPLDVVAAWTQDRHILTVAILNPTEAEQTLEWKFVGAVLPGKNNRLWRLASNEPDGQNPVITSQALNPLPATLELPRFSVTICELPVNP